MSKQPNTVLVNFIDQLAMGTRSIQASMAENGLRATLVFLKVPTGDYYGFEYRKRDYPNYPTDREFVLLGELLAGLRPEIIGFSVRSFALGFARRASALARKAAPGALIIWGGSHPTIAPEECLADCDAVCIGEGEDLMVEVVDAVGSGRPLDGIGNLWFRRNGGLIRNPLRPLIQDLDRLPFPLFGVQDKYVIRQDRVESCDPMLSRGMMYCVLASRGCPFACDFCSNSRLRQTFRGCGPFVRKRSPRKVIDELLRACQELDVGSVAFDDEIFGLDREWAREFLPLYTREIGRPFIASFHPRVMDEELAAACFAGGLAMAHLGVQTGSESFRKSGYHRQETNDQVREASWILHKARINCYYDFIFDNPYETSEDLQATLNLMLELPRPHNAKLFSLCWFPGTSLTDRALADGLIRPQQQDQYTLKSIHGHWAKPWVAYGPDHVFFSGLCWLEQVKYDPRSREARVFSNDLRARHLVPRPLLRLLARSRILRRKPERVYVLTGYFILFVNLLLLPYRKFGRMLTMARRQGWGAVVRRIFLGRR